jgi:DNA-binding NarL/FixJ family response regulator
MQQAPGKWRILIEPRAIIVDDHPIVRNALVTALVTLRVFEEVETANCFQELDEKLNRDSAYQLLILDLSLTDISGPGGIVFMREHYPEIPILVFSASDSVDTIIQCFEHGVHGFVSKNSSMQIFVNAIRTVLAGGVYIPPSASHRMGFELSESMESKLEPADQRPNFTAKQREVFEQLLLGIPNKVIATRLGMAEGTVKTHSHNIYRLLRVNSRAQAILKSQQLHIID